MSNLYEASAIYNGHANDRTPFTEIVFTADDDLAAETFARFLMSDWTDSTISLARLELAHIPTGYACGDALDVRSHRWVIEEWETT